MDAKRSSRKRLMEMAGRVAVSESFEVTGRAAELQ
jgi:hypothetical protein